MPDSSAIPVFAEPFFMGLDAQVVFTPVMNIDDLQRASPSPGHRTKAPLSARAKAKAKPTFGRFAPHSGALGDGMRSSPLQRWTCNAPDRVVDRHGCWPRRQRRQDRHAPDSRWRRTSRALRVTSTPTRSRRSPPGPTRSTCTVWPSRSTTSLRPSTSPPGTADTRSAAWRPAGHVQAHLSPRPQRHHRHAPLKT